MRGCFEVAEDVEEELIWIVPGFVFVGYVGEEIRFGVVTFSHVGWDRGDGGGVVVEDYDFVDAEYGGCAADAAGEGGFGFVGFYAGGVLVRGSYS